MGLERNGVPHRTVFVGPARFIYITQYTAASMNASATTVRVSRDTLSELERFQKALRTKTADETIREVLKLQRATVIGRLSGSLRGRVTRFAEADRIDTDY